jgi:flagellar biosynthetic protein FliP
MNRLPAIVSIMAACSIIPSVYAQNQLDSAVKPAAATPSGLTRSLVIEKEPSTSPLGIKPPQMPSLESVTTHKTTVAPTSSPANLLDDTNRLTSQLPGWLMMAGVTFLPAALLMTTSFVRIQITLSLLRQALGSPSVPGNQVIVALSLLLTILIMRPVGDRVYEQAVTPYLEGRMTQADAVRTGIEPVRRFMIAQILNTGHRAYLEELADYARDQEGRGKAQSTARPPANPESASSTENLPLHVVAPAFLLSELTTALLIGFAVYLPFLIVDLVVATILAAMGLWMMPPSLVSTPAKLILFVLADGWMLTAGALMNGFSVS